MNIGVKNVIRKSVLPLHYILSYDRARNRTVPDLWDDNRFFGAHTSIYNYNTKLHILFSQVKINDANIKQNWYIFMHHTPTPHMVGSLGIEPSPFVLQTIVITQLQGLAPLIILFSCHARYEFYPAKLL
jgi:hypothetical protein